MKSKKKANLVFIAVQFFYWMGYALVIGYASVYLLAIPFSNASIGLILAISSILSIILQMAAGSILDKHPELSLQKFIIGFDLAVVLPALGLILSGANRTAVTLCMLIIASAHMAIHPLLNSLCIRLNRSGLEINYGFARGIGSTAYALGAMGIGALISRCTPFVLPYAILFSSSCLLIVFIFFRYDSADETVEVSISAAQNPDTASLTTLEFFRKSGFFMLFLAGTTVLFFSHNLINNFYVQVVNAVKGNSAQMGIALFIASMVDLPAMACFNWLKKRLSCEQMLMISSVAFSVKHILTWLAGGMALLYTASFCQIGAYALFIPASVYYVGQVVDKQNQAKGQAMLSAAITLSSVFASFLGGFMLDGIGVPQTLLFGALASLLGTAIVFVAVHTKKIASR